MKERIVITGSEGTIGTVLKKGLAGDYDITPVDILLGKDVRDYKQFLDAVRGHFAIIHLAWNSKTENFANENIDPDSSLMALNVYKAAREAGVKKVIVASSVHADSFYGVSPFLSTEHTPVPDSPYGADKVFIETLGKYFAKGGLEVVALRFGGINPANIPPSLDNYPKEERAAWLSHNDCISLIRKVLGTEKIPGNFALVYAVSDNKGRVHDIANPFEWTPLEKAEDF